MFKIDIDDLEIVKNGDNILNFKRVSKKTPNKNKSYNDASEKHKKDCNPSGGFKKGSGHHYDRGFKY